MKTNNPFAAAPEEEGPVGPPLSEAKREMFRQAKSLEDIIRAADKPSEAVAYVMEGNRFKTLDEANELLHRINEKWNTTPRPDLFEHSPKEAAYLLYELPMKIDGISFDMDLADHEDAISRSKLFRNWRAMLEYFSAHEAGMTAKGNLNRKAVEELKGILEMSPPLTKHLEWIRNEYDWEELNTLRVCAQYAGFLARRKGKWRTTRKGKALLAQNSPSAIYLSLFDAWFNQLDWDTLYTREILEQIRFQNFRFFILSALDKTAATWTDQTLFFGRLFREYFKLEFDREAMQRYPRQEEFELRYIFNYPLFDYLDRMGMVETRQRDTSGSSSADIYEIRMTELGKRVVRSLRASVTDDLKHPPAVTSPS